MTTTRDSERTVLHIAPGAGDVVEVLGDTATFKVPESVSGGSLILAEIVTQPGGGPPSLHGHPTEEAFYVLEGEFEVSGLDQDGEQFGARAVAGSVVYVPPGAAHNFRNVASGPGRLLVMYTSPELERMARELANLPVDAPPDRTRVMKILSRHGIRFVEPAHSSRIQDEPFR